MDNTLCPSCQQANQCQYNSANPDSAKHCWCMQEPKRQLPKPTQTSCYCPSCLRRFPAEQSEPQIYNPTQEQG